MGVISNGASTSHCTASPSQSVMLNLVQHLKILKQVQDDNKLLLFEDQELGSQEIPQEHGTDRKNLYYIYIPMKNYA